MLSNRKCQPLARYPINLMYSAGNLLHRKPLICGGYSGQNPQSECLIHDLHTDSWRHHVLLTTSRFFHASVPVNGTIWFSGGLGGYPTRELLSSTEFVYGDESVVQGPSLPTGRYAHCVVDLLDGRSMVIGGNPTFKEVITYHHVNHSFTTGPPLLHGRMDQACTLYRSPLHGYRNVVLIVGGYDNHNNLYSTEVLDFSDSTASWQKCECNPFFTISDYFSSVISQIKIIL